MKTKFEQVANSLSQLGLQAPAQYVQSIYNLIKLSSINTSMEVQVLLSLSKIATHLAKKDFDDIVEEDIYLPSFLFTSEGKTYTKQQESIQGYTKFEILQGLQNYLETFTKHYLYPKKEQVYYEYRSSYDQAIKELEKIIESIHHINRQLRGVSKETVKSSLANFNVKTKNITDYLNTVKRDLPKITTHGDIQVGSWSGVPSNIQKQLPKDEARTWASLFQFSWDKVAQAELQQIDKQFMEEKGISSYQFYQIVKSFRPNLVRAASLHYAEISKDDEDDDIFELPSKTEEVVEVTEDETDEDEASPPPPPGRPLSGPLSEAFKHFHQQQSQKKEWEVAAKYYKSLDTMVKAIVKDKSLISRDVVDAGISGEKLLRGFTDILLDKYRKAYESLLEHSYDAYVTMYEGSQQEQESLPISLINVAKMLQNLGE